MSSKRRWRRKACGHKHRHASMEKAVAHLIALAKSGQNTSGMRAYRCRFGDHYHVGHFGRRVA